MDTGGIQNVTPNVTVLEMCGGLSASGGAKAPTRGTPGTSRRRNAPHRDLASLPQGFPSGVAGNDPVTIPQIKHCREGKASTDASPPLAVGVGHHGGVRGGARRPWDRGHLGRTWPVPRGSLGSWGVGRGGMHTDMSHCWPSTVTAQTSVSNAILQEREPGPSEDTAD